MNLDAAHSLSKRWTMMYVPPARTIYRFTLDGQSSEQLVEGLGIAPERWASGVASQISDSTNPAPW